MVKNIFFLEKVDSTQLLAKKFIALKNDLVIVAKKQERGYGRFQRDWYSPVGGLYFSILLNLANKNFFLFDIIFHIVKRIVLSCEELFNLKEKLLIKWPNDIYYQDKKLCGILAEKEDDFLIVGCGININNSYFPQEILSPISLKEILKREISSYEKYLLLDYILLNIDYQKIERKELLGFLRERNYLKDKKIKITSHYGEIIGTCLDIADDYSLVLNDGHKINAGEVVKIFYE